jgi:DNA-binding NarL/FixJ family response regulator
LETSPVRVLVVDDYEPFRRFVCSTLGKSSDLQVVGEADDGLEAIHKAEELQPDLIVLDIGLPTLNGIEAARRIRKLSPESKILFVSQESSADVVQAALRVGALGYVVKSHAGIELLAAVQAVRQGGRFLSSGLSGQHSTDASDSQALDRLRRKEDVPSLVARKAEMASSHKVHFYRDDASFVVGLTGFIEAALEAGNPLIVVATEPHRKSLLQRLQAKGLNIGAAIEQGRYIPLDVNETLSTFMVNDLPDPVQFQKVAGDLIAAAAKTANGEHPRRVAACGECGLLEQGKVDAAIQVERLWNEIAKSCDVDILCGYVLTNFQLGLEGHIYERICAEHSAVCFQ